MCDIFVWRCQFDTNFVSVHIRRCTCLCVCVRLCVLHKYYKYKFITPEKKKKNVPAKAESQSVLCLKSLKTELMTHYKNEVAYGDLCSSFCSRQLFDNFLFQDEKIESCLVSFFHHRKSTNAYTDIAVLPEKSVILLMFLPAAQVKKILWVFESLRIQDVITRCNLWTDLENDYCSPSFSVTATGEYILLIVINCMHYYFVFVFMF